MTNITNSCSWDKDPRGDFSYSQFNYDTGETFERDKDIKTGIEQFVVTTYFDHRLKLARAFSIADVVAIPLIG